MAEIREWMGGEVTLSGTNAAKAALQLWFGKALGRIAPNIWNGVKGGKAGKGAQRSRQPATEAEMRDWFGLAVALGKHRPRFQRGVLIYRWLYEGALRKQDMQRLSVDGMKQTACGNWEITWEQQKTKGTRGMVVSAELRKHTLAFRREEEKKREEAKKGRKDADPPKEAESAEPLEGPLFDSTLLGTTYTVIYHTVELQKEMARLHPSHAVTTGLNPHYMRHCRLTHLSKTMSDAELQDFSGHANGQSLRKYVHGATGKALRQVD